MTPMTSAGRAGFPSIRLSFLLSVLLAPSMACVTTSMTAQQARTPVLVGPVSCIGCPAAPPDFRSFPATISDANAHTDVHTVFSFNMEEGAHPPDLERKVQMAVPDPCAAEIRIARIKAIAQGIFVFFFMSTYEQIEVDAAVVPAPGGACGARP